MAGRAEAIQRWADSVADRLGVTVWGFVAGTAAVVAAAVGGLVGFGVAGRGSGGGGAAARGDRAGALRRQPEPVFSPDGRIVVHVEGAVVFPGVHDLAEGSRVHDAIDAASGLTADADRSRLNLAAPLADGQRVWVPVIGEPEPEVVGPSNPGGSLGGSTGARGEPQYR